MCWANRHGTYIDKFTVVSLSEIVEDCGIVQMRHVRHVFNFFEFGWIDREYIFLFQIFGLLMRGKKKMTLIIEWGRM